MSTPAYDGQRQPAASQGWFAGLSAWWNSLTPQYATIASVRNGSASRGSANAPAPASSSAPASATGAAPSAPSKPIASSASSAASGADSSATPCAARP